MAGVAGRSGPPKNVNSSKPNRLWGDTIHRVITQENSKKLRAAAEALVDRAISGDTSALRELGDRIDGKVPQGIVGADGGPIEVAEVPWLKQRER